MKNYGHCLDFEFSKRACLFRFGTFRGVVCCHLQAQYYWPSSGGICIPSNLMYPCEVIDEGHIKISCYGGLALQ